AVIGVLAKGAFAQQARPLRVEDAVGMKDFDHSPEMSPDGNWLAYTAITRKLTAVTSENVFVSKGASLYDLGTDVFVVNIKTTQVKNITGGKGANWLPCWSPDGRFIAFLSTRENEQSQLWLWDSRADQVRRVSEVPVRIFGHQQIEWTSDSRKVLLTTVPENMSVAEYVNRITTESLPTRGTESMRTPGSSALLYEGGLARAQGAQVTESNALSLAARFNDLVSFDVSTGEKTALLRDKGISLFHRCADGKHVVYSSPVGMETAGSQQILYDLIVLNVVDGGEKILESRARLDFSGEFSLSPDGSQLSYRVFEQGPDALDLHVVRLDGGPMRNLSQSKDSASKDLAGVKSLSPFMYMPLWDSQGRYIYTVTRGDLLQTDVREGTTKELAHIEGHQILRLSWRADGGTVWVQKGTSSTIVIAQDMTEKQQGFFKIDLDTGAVSKLLEQGECYTCEGAYAGRNASVSSGTGSFAYLAEDAQHPPDIWWNDGHSATSVRLSHLNPQLDGYKMGAAQTIRWLDDDGKELSGALLLPSDYEAGKRYPLVVLVYGGVSLSKWLYQFGGFERGMACFNVQLLATRGYAVLMPDTPQHLGTPMLDLAKTVLPGVSKAVELGIADPERVGVFGHSYGGYSTLALIVQTTRFKAAVEADGYGDLIGNYGEMKRDGEAFGTSADTSQQLMGDSLWNRRERYIENSPVFYLDRVETPLLILHGSDDTAVASFLGDEIFVGLRRLGKRVSYARYEGESHVPEAYANQIDIANRMIAWFDEYLKAQPPQIGVSVDGRGSGMLKPGAPAFGYSSD
ncbi:MAG: prolyl oligopeptidase family serine peptidase, partial [Candidatus Acidiferrales bacterium]